MLSYAISAGNSSDPDWFVMTVMSLVPQPLRLGIEFGAILPPVSGNQAADLARKQLVVQREFLYLPIVGEQGLRVFSRPLFSSERRSSAQLP